MNFNQLTDTVETVIKLQIIFNKNKVFHIVCNISKILTGKEENVSDLGIPEDLLKSHMAYFKCAPTTSEDVERLFSFYKKLLAPNKRTFKFENTRNR